MLIALMSRRQITQVPYAAYYKRCTKKLTLEIKAIKAELNRMIDGSDIHTAGWMPGVDWRGTPFQAIHEKATGCDPTLAARLFGLIVWEVFMERPETWTSGRFEKDGEPIGSRTYFRVDRS